MRARRQPPDAGQTGISSSAARYTEARLGSNPDSIHYAVRPDAIITHASPIRSIVHPEGSVPPVDQPLHLIHVLHRRRQILKPVFGNQDIVLDPHPAHLPILVQHLEIDVRGVNRVAEVGLDDKAAEVNLRDPKCFISMGRMKGRGKRENLHQVRQ